MSEERGFGRRLKELRCAQVPFLSQERLGLRVGESQETISRWENDHVRPKLEKLPKLAKALNTTVDSLLTLYDEESPQREPSNNGKSAEF